MKHANKNAIIAAGSDLNSQTISLASQATGCATKSENDAGSQGNTDNANEGTVSVISKNGDGCFAEKKMLSDPAWGTLFDDLAVMSVMQLRKKYEGEANTHRNMLSRIKTKGATVHNDFRKFVDFLRVVGPKPTKKATLDRIDNKDPEYAPGKVRWADKQTQNRNKTDSSSLARTRGAITLLHS
jgi:hypothetical protein